MKRKKITKQDLPVSISMYIYSPKSQSQTDIKVKKNNNNIWQTIIVMEMQ